MTEEQILKAAQLIQLRTKIDEILNRCRYVQEPLQLELLVLKPMAVGDNENAPADNDDENDLIGTISIEDNDMIVNALALLGKFAGDSLKGLQAKTSEILQ